MLDGDGKYDLVAGLAQDESDGIADERSINQPGGLHDDKGATGG
jgi:hypothetical protein